ncbi:MAG TPA: acetate kinase [Bacteroidales bacterium]|nr:acetate kinase [Bacteroidales bacterium]
MKILVLNCGSSSIKYQLFDLSKEHVVLAKGLLDRVGLSNSVLTHKPIDKESYIHTQDIKDHITGINLIIETLTNPVYGVIKNTSEIDAVGHRVVHGGEKFSGSVKITQEIIDKMEECVPLAPLHNPANLQGIYAISKILPNTPQCGVFDTAFHQTMPEHVYLYGLPYEMYEKYRVRRYGFHGTSHGYVAKKACDILKIDINKTKIITCHLGNGASIAAIKNGKSYDTSMGLTPVEGVIMGTRCGDLDLGAFLYIMEKENLDIKAANNLINKKSGVLGISGISSDMRDLENAAANGNYRAQLALKMYAYRVKKYVGAYAAAMGGVDLIIFTGGIGENDDNTREAVCEELEFMGVVLDKNANKGLRGKDAIISSSNSKVKVMTITTNEELVIALESVRILKE